MFEKAQEFQMAMSWPALSEGLAGRGIQGVKERDGAKADAVGDAFDVAWIKG